MKYNLEYYDQCFKAAKVNRDELKPTELFLDLGYANRTYPEDIEPEFRTQLVLLSRCGLIELRKDGWDLTQLGQRVYNKASA